MIQTLKIEKVAPNEYAVEVLNDHSVALDFTASSIAGAIRDAAKMLPTAQAFHIWFEHVSIGITPAINMRHDPETLANRLKLLHGQAWG